MGAWGEQPSRSWPRWCKISLSFSSSQFFVRRKGGRSNRNSIFYKTLFLVRRKGGRSLTRRPVSPPGSSNVKHDPYLNQGLARKKDSNQWLVCRNHTLGKKTRASLTSRWCGLQASNLSRHETLACNLCRSVSSQDVWSNL